MKKNNSFNRALYTGFSLFGCYKLIALHFGEGAMYLGIALAFDPFDQNTTWNARPLWQRMWLIVHLAICAASLGLELGIGDSTHTP